jgi:integrase
MRAMLSLTWQQVDLGKKRAWVSSSEMKAGHSLGIPLTAEAIQVLNALPRDGDYVFQWRGERIDDCNTLAFQNAVKAAKVEPLRWHDLRHTWASWAVQSGVRFARAHVARRLAQLLDGAAVLALRAAPFGAGCSQNKAKIPHKNRTVKRAAGNSLATH